jgi:hypothetical protein
VEVCLTKRKPTSTILKTPLLLKKDEKKMQTHIGFVITYKNIHLQQKPKKIKNVIILFMTYV